MKDSPKPSLPLRALLARPERFVARFVLAELIAKRGRGPLERKNLLYRKRRRR